MFVCAFCRKHNKSGDNCKVCIEVRAKLQDVGPYSLDFTAYQARVLEAQAEAALRVAEKAYRAKELAEYRQEHADEIKAFWQRREEEKANRRPALANFDPWGFDTDAHPCLDDFSMPRETRARAQCQLELEFDLMPDLDIVPSYHALLINHPHKLTPSDVKDIRRLVADHKLTHSEIAREFSITPGMIGHIKAGRTWKGK